MKDANDTGDEPDILEHNVATLLETGGERPRMTDLGRARIRKALIAELAVAGAAAAVARRRAMAYVVAGGIAAVAAIVALVVFVGSHGGGSGGGFVATPQVTAGSDTIQLADGSTAVVAAGATLARDNPRRVRVTGEVLFDVVPGATPFVVDTEHGRIEVHGTRFVVDGEAARTTAAVIRGEVALASDTGQVVLHAGEQGVAEPGKPPTRGPAPRLSHLVAWAQQARRELEHAPPVHHGTLYARFPDNPFAGEQPLPLVKLGVDVVVEDRIARVALDQTFRNPTGYDLEGMYRFSIPPDAALQRLAMYVDGKLTESAVVERMAARRIYEEQVYHHIDPALLEWAGTGKLALRVYPLPVSQDKRLMVAYTQSLPRLYDDWTLTVPLPDVDQPVGDLDVTMRLAGCANCEITSTSHKIVVGRHGDDATVTYQASRATLADSLVLHVRDARKGVTAATATDGSDRYVMVRAAADVGSGAAPYRPRTWVLLDDVSGSRDALARRAQADLVDAFLRELDEDDHVAVFAFDVAARRALATTRVRDVDRARVRAALTGEDGGVGATDLGAGLDAAVGELAGPGSGMAAPADDATVVYLGDGVVTAGPLHLDELAAKLRGKARFVGVGVGDGPDTQTLDALAAATGGYSTTIDLADDLGWRAFDLVAALHTARVTGVTARLVDGAGSDVAATAYLRSPQLADGEEIELVARLAAAAKAAPVAVVLDGTRDGKPWRQRVELSAAHDHAGYLPRLWAQRHVAARLLAKHEPVVVPPCDARAPKQQTHCATEQEVRDARDEVIRKEVVELGKRYFLLSRHTSLLVLENDAMYAKYGITKGAGDTWAPYAMPATIQASPAPAPVPQITRTDAPLVRTPLQLFYDYGGSYYGRWRGDIALSGRVSMATPDDSENENEKDKEESAVDASPMALDEGKMGKRDDDKSGGYDDQDHAEAANGPAPAVTAQPVDTVDTGTTTAMPDQDVALQQGIEFEGRELSRRAHISGYLGYRDAWHKPSVGWEYTNEAGLDTSGGQLVAQRLSYPGDPAFDDLTAHIPALVPGAVDHWHAMLGPVIAGSRMPIDPAAAALLERARAALPTGVYHWDDADVALDTHHDLGWTRTTATGLVERAGLGAMIWTRTYPELGLAVSRQDLGHLPIALAMLPMWIASDGEYLAYFAVRARGDHAVALVRKRAGAEHVELVLTFDDAAHLVSIADGGGRELVAVTWGAAGPTAGRVDGRTVAASFTATTVADASTWAGADASETTIASCGSAAARSNPVPPGCAETIASCGSAAARSNPVPPGCAETIASCGSAAARSNPVPPGCAETIASCGSAAARSNPVPPGCAETIASCGSAAARSNPVPPGCAETIASCGSAAARSNPVPPGCAETIASCGSAAARSNPVPPGCAETIASCGSAAARSNPVPPGCAETIDLPLHQPTYWASRLATLAPGSVEWRHAMRQRLASLAALQQLPDLASGFRALADHGGATLGDVVLASGAASAMTDNDLNAALAPFAGTPVARYLATAHAYAAGRAVRELPDPAQPGLVTGLWTLREVTAELPAGKLAAAVDRAAAIPERAPMLRLVAAAAVSARAANDPRASDTAAQVSRAWDAAAIGAQANIARAQAVTSLYRLGLVDAAADRVARYGTDLDLDAPPATLPNPEYIFQTSRRGDAGWQLASASWGNRVIAGNSFAHVVSLLEMSPPQHDVQPLLTRAAELAGDDVGHIVEVAELATRTGKVAWAETLVRPAVARVGTHALHALLAGLELQQGKVADGLAELEAAQDAVAAGDTGDDVAIQTERAELAQIVAYAKVVAAQWGGNQAEREQVVRRALRYGARWREVAPNDASVDAALGELALSVGDTAEAWRQLSTAIERDPMSGDGYALVATAFEQQGRVADAVGYWDQAVRIDQTNPTPRLREAQALAALGRDAEADKILHDIVGRHWHERWDGVAEEARELLAHRH